jgi:hypothetical protein
MFCSLAELKMLSRTLDRSTSYPDKVLIHYARSAASEIIRRLCTYFPRPLTVQATGAVTIDANPVDGDELTVGLKDYKFVAALAAANDVLIGSDEEETATNLAFAISEGDYGDYHSNTTINTVAGVSSVSGSTISLFVYKGGPAGNDTPLSTTCGDITITDFSGGLREFPDLVTLNIHMATYNAFIGQLMTNAGGSNSREKDQRMKAIDRAFESLIKSGCLEDTTGAVLERNSKCFKGDSNYPAADMQSPEYWGHDPSRDWYRSGWPL